MSQYGDEISECRLVPSGHGKFHVYFNGESVLEHRHNPHYWPEAKDVADKIKEWIAAQ